MYGSTLARREERVTSGREGGQVRGSVVWTVSRVRCSWQGTPSAVRFTVWGDAVVVDLVYCQLSVPVVPLAVERQEVVALLQPRVAASEGTQVEVLAESLPINVHP